MESHARPWPTGANFVRVRPTGSGMPDGAVVHLTAEGDPVGGLTVHLWSAPPGQGRPSAVFECVVEASQDGTNWAAVGDSIRSHLA